MGIYEDAIFEVLKRNPGGVAQKELEHLFPKTDVKIPARNRVINVISNLRKTHALTHVIETLGSGEATWYRMREK